ncbi:MAG: ribosomal protein S18-alanine N-acetyltransferase [Dehalococcoidia bacterium]|nr:ribosomal protein S18-alanine N-acetyltransferase [Dehalococcoidia bacterium]
MTVFSVRPMHIEDLSQAVEIEREAFPTQWPPTPFKRELGNKMAHYLVAWQEGHRWDPPPRRGALPLLSRVGHLLCWGRHRPQNNHSDQPFIVGVVGFWLLYDEAHITTIAVRRSHRRLGLGEMLLHASIEMAVALRARVVTLEVRATNTDAQALYEKYGFHQSGVRRGYYTDNNEDALIMTTDSLESASFRDGFQLLKQELIKRMHAAPSMGNWPLS